MSAPTEAELWERIVYPRGSMSVATARRILDLGFTDQDRTRMHELAERNRREKLSVDEEAELDHYCRVGTLISILKVRARRLLKSRSRSA